MIIHHKAGIAFLLLWFLACDTKSAPDTLFKESASRDKPSVEAPRLSVGFLVTEPPAIHEDPPAEARVTLVLTEEGRLSERRELGTFKGGCTEDQKKPPESLLSLQCWFLY